MRRILSMTLILTCTAFYAVADSPDKSDKDANVKRFAERINQLEKRVAMLEAMLKKQLADAKKKAPESWAPSPYAPKYYPQQPPKTYVPPQPYRPAPGTPVPPVQPRRDKDFVPTPSLPKLQPPKQNVPDPPTKRKWQRFEFNGESFYIIPVEEMKSKPGADKRD